MIQVRGTTYIVSVKTTDIPELMLNDYSVGDMIDINLPVEIKQFIVSCEKDKKVYKATLQLSLMVVEK